MNIDRDFDSDAFERAPGARAIASIVWTMLFFAIFLTFAEASLRNRGYVPIPRDSDGLWSYHRAKVPNLGTEDVIVLGSSRAQLGFSLGAFQSRFTDRKVLQLSKASTHPLGTLRDIAENTSFSGVLLVNLHVTSTHPENLDSQDRIVEYYARSKSWDREFAYWTARVQQHLCVLHWGLTPQSGINAMFHTARPAPRHLQGNSHREIWADFSKTPDRVEFAMNRDSQELTDGYRRRRGASAEEWLRWFAPFQRVAATIEARGGAVVFVNFPVSGPLAHAMDNVFPKEDFWDALGRAAGAKTIHYRDYPELSRFNCPDNSHLDMRDREAFTLSLLDVLVQEGHLATPVASDTPKR